MTEKTKALRAKLTERQVKFGQHWIIEGLTKKEAYEKAGFNGKTKGSVNTVVSRMLNNVDCGAYFDALKAEKDIKLQRVTNISRTTQLNALERARDLAEKLKNPSAMVSAIREQNEMLGYHRDKAPNAEKEALKRARLDKEGQKVAELTLRMAKLRVDEESEEKPQTIKVGVA